MSGSNVWTRSRDKMRMFSELFAECSLEAAAYGRCVAATTTTSAGRRELQKDGCSREFGALKSCFMKAAKKKGK